MTTRLSRLARRDPDDIRPYTVKTWGRKQWLTYFPGLVRAFEGIAADPDGGRDRSPFAAGLRSVNYRRHACSPTQPSRSLRPGCGWQDDGRALRAQFYRESRNETLPGHPRALHAVDSVAPVLAIGGPCGVQDDVAITGASQGIRFDPPDSLSILEVHAQAVGGRKADDFQV